MLRNCKIIEIENYLEDFLGIFSCYLASFSLTSNHYSTYMQWTSEHLLPPKLSFSLISSGLVLFTNWLKNSHWYWFLNIIILYFVLDFAFKFDLMLFSIRIYRAIFIFIYEYYFRCALSTQTKNWHFTHFPEIKIFVHMHIFVLAIWKQKTENNNFGCLNSQNNKNGNFEEFAIQYWTLVLYCNSDVEKWAIIKKDLINAFAIPISDGMTSEILTSKHSISI